MSETLGTGNDPSNSTEFEVDLVDEISAYIRIVFWSSLFLGALYFVLKNTVKFVQEYQGDPEVIVQGVSEREVMGEESEQAAILGSVLDDAQYRSLGDANSSNNAERSRGLGWMRQMHASRQRGREDDVYTDQPRRQIRWWQVADCSLM